MTPIQIGFITLACGLQIIAIICGGEKDYIRASIYTVAGYLALSKVFLL